MRVSSNLLLALLLAGVASASCAATVCVTNKNGVGETWQTNERDTSLLKSSGACSDVTSSPVGTVAGVRYAPMPALAMASQTAMASAPLGMSAQVWHTTPADQTMRQLISKWSTTVGWTSVWSVDKDIPLESLDQTTGDFKSAVRRLLSTTALSDVNLKPCFYTNNVVRVVRETTKCNPNE